ncbi:unnamed protein product [Paramecium octaurelia]|uniref:Coatomer subunit delta n=1 Tax=Paramecium octaurelia TaxID=43137 RepID=A0A8S1VCK4_PAROT|nr:unnamed protein product [Paramecium octaurelia]
MVIISAAICDKNGILFIGRQFQGITTNELKEQVRNFPKLISPTQQHTFIDHENLRYIYTPIDNIYIVLITSKNSNIIEDLEVLRILKNVLSDICQQVSEESIKKNSFEILLAIDDIISAGLRESTTTSQVQTALEMESSEEKIHMMLTRARENEAKEQAKKHQMEMERKRQEELAQKKSQKQSKAIDNAFKLPQNEEKVNPAPKSEIISENLSTQSQVLQKQSNVKQAPKKGMQLTKKKEATSFE